MSPPAVKLYSAEQITSAITAHVSTYSDARAHSHAHAMHAIQTHEWQQYCPATDKQSNHSQWQAVRWEE